MKTIQINTLADRDKVLAVIGTMFDAHGALDVVVKTQDESITTAQRGLYFVWCGVIGNDLGNSKDEQHQYFKERYLLNIYLSDPHNHPELVNAGENMGIVKENCPEQYPYIRSLVMKGVSTRDASKKNMMELLKEVEAMARSLDIRLPLPPRKGLVEEQNDQTL